MRLDDSSDRDGINSDGLEERLLEREGTGYRRGRGWEFGLCAREQI